jgi:hypothetical protein
MIYWPVSTREALARKQLSMRESDKAKLALESVTVDHVAPGEQQPESDHNFQGSDTETGVFSDRHWRHASGWFSYDLKNPTNEARRLRVTYYGNDKDRTFDIYINNTLLETVTLDGSHGDNFYDVDYTLPEQLVRSSDKVMKIKFAAHSGSVAGGIYYVRLMK